MKPVLNAFNTKLGPKAIGPYSTAMVHKGLMYVSGQLGLDPKSLKLVSDDVEEQTRKAFENFCLLLK
jgi:2-iminobutanoate/2-iminopropanoate deaminase